MGFLLWQGTQTRLLRYTARMRLRSSLRWCWKMPVGTGIFQLSDIFRHHGRCLPTVRHLPDRQLSKTWQHVWAMSWTVVETLGSCGKSSRLLAVALPHGCAPHSAGCWGDREDPALPVTDNWVGRSLPVPVLNPTVSGALRSLFGDEQDHQHQALPHR